MTQYNRRDKSWTKSKEKRRTLSYKKKFWSEMFDIVQSNNIRLELEISRNKKRIEDLNMKFNNVTNNYQKSIEIINEWKKLFYNQIKATEKWEKKYYRYVEYIKEFLKEFIKNNCQGTASAPHIKIFWDGECVEVVEENVIVLLINITSEIEHEELHYFMLSYIHNEKKLCLFE
ncbi:hypothetical protein RclHR1_12540003 [Rhizophagus clarus]|uniref:Uncharacterized protein n=1 Tax=Rhizophagus clarus TaxID=94130 RepID=A0A2Z6Q7D4_9GLOM|nr:hypothetical protein RclHR1_12540003 [Rhizophagus clarus]GES94382.1 hypothetical protein GLOIN_2v1763680 [Rhizophagus clarus]